MIIFSPLDFFKTQLITQYNISVVKRRIVLGFGFALLLLAVLVYTVGSQNVVGELTQADRQLLAVALCSGLVALAFRGLVWGTFISLIDESMSRSRIAAIFLTAMFVKYVTPYGQLATEPFVAYLIARDGEMAFENGLAGILSADLLNYVPYYTFGFLALGLVLTGDALGTGMYSRLVAFGGLFVTLVALVFVAVRRPAVVYTVVLGVTGGLRRLLGRITNRFDAQLAREAVTARLDGFYTSLETISTDRPALLTAIVSAHLGMVFLMIPVYVGGLALGHTISIPVVVLAVAFGKLGSVVPAPGGTGGVEAMVAATLATLGGLEWAVAVSVALIYRLCTYWLTIAVGGLSAAGWFVRGP